MGSEMKCIYIHPCMREVMTIIR